MMVTAGIREQYKKELLPLVSAGGISREEATRILSVGSIKEMYGAVIRAKDRIDYLNHQSKLKNAVDLAGGVSIPKGGVALDSHYKLIFGSSKAEIKSFADLGFLLDDRGRVLGWNSKDADATVIESYRSRFGLQDGGVNRRTEIWSDAIARALSEGKRFIALQEKKVIIDSPKNVQNEVLLFTTPAINKQVSVVDSIPVKSEKGFDAGRVIILIGVVAGVLGAVIAIISLMKGKRPIYVVRRSVSLDSP